MMLDDHPSSAGERASDPGAELPIVPSDLPRIESWTDAGVTVLKLPEGPGFEVLRSCLREQMPRLGRQLQGRTVRLDFGARDLVLLDLRRLVNVLKQEFSVEATGLYVRREVLHRFAERELKLKVFPTEPTPVFAAPAPDPVEDARTEMFEPPAPPAEPAIVEAEAAVADAASAERIAAPALIEPAAAAEPAPEPPPVAVAVPAATPVPAPAREEGRKALTVQRTLRSGNALRFDGDLYVFGDVNPGAQITATGNITVLGALKGTAHAGSNGDESAFILAFEMRPMQLRIGRTIAIPPARKPDGGLDPEIAQVRDGQVVIEAWRRTR